jgi:hypothetical protein
MQGRWKEYLRLACRSNNSRIRENFDFEERGTRKMTVEKRYRQAYEAGYTAE